MVITEWAHLEYDRQEERDYFLRYVIRDDGKTVEQIASKKIDEEMSGLKIYRQQFVKKEGLQTRPMTDEERELARARRGRGMGVEPSTIVTTLANQHGFVASLSNDCDGGLGTVEMKR